MRIRKILAFILRFFLVINEDLFIFTGLGILIGTTFMVNKIAGWYSLGTILLFLGLLLSRKPPRKGG